MLYLTLKTIHLVALISWMAALFYLPRLFVYHAGAAKGSELSETLKLMEYRLQRIILTPAMLITFAAGIGLILQNPELLQSSWLQLKLLLVFCLAGVHGYLCAARRRFAADQNVKSARFYRILNEVPTLLLIGIIILVVFKPF